MNLSTLNVFSKNTDAFASIRGYNYQTLKTLEQWIENLLNNKDEEIYCDYEEDIFQKDLNNKSVKFRQLKLYSSNFSFKSEEIEKCISHFFMLHVKTDYLQFDKEFVFETNSDIAGKYRDNDAELLRNWSENQHNLPDDILQDCTNKVKLIVTEYIEKESDSKKDLDALNIAISVFNSLDDDFWRKFTLMIKWNFSNIDPNLEFSNTVSTIENLIKALPYNINESIFGELYTKVSLVASEANPEIKKLTINNLESIILSFGSNNDIWYSEVYQKWKDVEIEEFRIGEFYEIINAVKHCRWNNYLSNHINTWLKILEFYIYKLTTQDDIFNKKAVYEYIWLKIRPNEEIIKHGKEINEIARGNINGCEKLIRLYFNDFASFQNAKMLEEANNLLQLIIGNSILNLENEKIIFDFTEFKSWYKKLISEINSQIVITKDPNEKCHLLEKLGTIFFFTKHIVRKKRKVDLHYYEKILEFIEVSSLYNASRLSYRINVYIKMLISNNSKNDLEVIKKLELFSEKLDPFIEKRQGKSAKARAQIERGILYINTGKPFLLLKALDYFHKAKGLWFQEENMEQCVITLLNISKLYSSLGLHIAAKYYSLGSIWLCSFKNDENLYSRISDSMAFVFEANFRQGAWLSAISDFFMFLNAHNEFQTKELDLFNDSIAFKVVSELSIILFTTPKISPQFENLIEYNKTKLNGLEEIINPSIETLDSSEDSIKRLIENHIDDSPLNDSGKIRIIKFNALGSLWEISFKNDYLTNSIAEEFCAILQITLAEISLSELDFHLLKGTLILNLNVVDKLRQPEQIPSNTKLKWNIFVQNFEGINYNEQNASVVVCVSFILNEISMLKDDEYSDLFTKLFSEYNLSDKTFSINSYQKIFRQVYSKTGFDSMQRDGFQTVITEYELPSENEVMKWKSDLSEKYDKVIALKHIHNRFLVSKKSAYLTLSNLKKEKDFQDFVNDLRHEGYLDWQIMLAIVNFIVLHKANLKANTFNVASEEDYMELVKKFADEYLWQDEKDFYIKFPFEAFQTDEFKLQFDIMITAVLNTNGLENKLRVPNFKALKEFMDIRFNMAFDMTNEDNPLFDIPRN